MKKLCFVLIGLLVFGGVEAQIINFPDANFKGVLLVANSTNIQIASTQALNANGYVSTYNKIDTNNDGEISIAEASVITWLSISGGLITDLTGIEYFTNLQYLDCNSNSLTNLNLSGVLNLKYLSCNNNNITSLNISGLINLYSMNCSFNLLTSLDVSGLINFGKFFCFYNQFTSLNFSGLTNLTYLDCNNNPLNSLFIKNGSVESTLNFYDIPNLEYVCADEAQVASIQNQIAGYGYTNCHVNSYCSFAPGGTFYTIQGNNRFDSNNNGCDASDINLSNLKFNLTNGTVSGSSISNASGNYLITVGSGTHTMVPILENPTYFNVSPTTATVTFPSATSPYIQDFCITANGPHDDLEVVILPMGRSRPGFDANYKIIYKNKGTRIQNNSAIFLEFNDANLDLVSATPSISSQTTNSLTWNYTNLLPFETREIFFTMNVNSPTETPAVNAGDVLIFTATAWATVIEETMNDNVSTLNQIVVNAFDPNYKTCTEGTTIAPSEVGKYVHYIIGFENDGTANAENIVVKDMIDTTKYDLTTLVPIKGSAPFTTRITNTNQVEFIFQNINLPFASGSNQGYVAFKIKTKPTLVLGDTFSNTANIFFDYNAPIVTNTATTTIAALINPEFVFTDYFTLSPIPTKGVLNINTKQDITISSISIYNTLGQVVLVTSNPSNTIDVSNLTTGSYFIKVITDKGSSSGKFIKE